MKIIGVNGILSTGKESTDRLGAALFALGYEFLDLDQPIRGAWGARLSASKDAIDIMDIAKDGDVVIAHSYGCLKTAIAAKVVDFKAIFLFRPAMSRYHGFASVSEETRIFCIHSKQDYVVLLGSLLLYHPFGLAGFSGFKSKRVKNIRSQGGHNDDFDDPQVGHWARFIHNTLELLK